MTPQGNVSVSDVTASFNYSPFNEEITVGPLCPVTVSSDKQNTDSCNIGQSLVLVIVLTVCFLSKQSRLI